MEEVCLSETQMMADGGETARTFPSRRFKIREICQSRLFSSQSGEMLAIKGEVSRLPQLVGDGEVDGWARSSRWIEKWLALRQVLDKTRRGMVPGGRGA